MKFEAAVCPHCSGNLQVPDDRDVIKCMYCGTDIFLKETNDSNRDKKNNLNTLAKSALNSKNYSEAYKYFTQILELDINNPEAWFGKGISAGYLSTIADYRCRELEDAFNMALEYSKTENFDDLKKKCSDSMFELGQILVITNKDYADKFKEVSGTAITYVSNLYITTEMLMKAKDYCPDNYKIPRYIADHCFIDPTISFAMTLKGNVCNNEEQKTYIKNSVIECTNIIKKNEPKYTSNSDLEMRGALLGKWLIALIIFGIIFAIFGSK